MARPLIISDCDEVLLHFATHFGDWLAEAHGITFHMAGNDFSQALRHTDTGGLVAPTEITRLIWSFFDHETPRQTPIAGAVHAVARLSEHADFVVLTNLQDHRQQMRIAQLAQHGINVRVFTNQGPKGPAIRAILDEYQPSRAFFIDDLAEHHNSAAEITPEITRLHLCGEPAMAPHIPCAQKAGHAHARIDYWSEALPWLLNQLQGEKP